MGSLRSIHRGLTPAALAMVGLLGGWGPGAHAEGADVIGAPQTYAALATMTLQDVARANGLGYDEIRAANPQPGARQPGADWTAILPTRHVLPDAPRRGIVVNLAEMRLYYFPPSGPVRNFPIGIGKAGKETPLGRTRIIGKAVGPVWVPTPSERAENPALPARVGPGPNNELGDRGLYLGWDEYLIHGTNNSDSIGRHDSHGCIKLYPDDIAALFALVPVGTPVLVVDQPAKVGWLAGELYLQVHPGAENPAAVDQMIARTAGKDAGRLDWAAIHRAERQRDGLVVRVTDPQ